MIRDFIRLTVDAGLDLFRIFDCLNNPEQMAVAIDEVKKRGAIAEACVCYTGNVSSKSETKYTLKYYVDVAKKLEAMGSDILCIKDMAGLLRPAGAKALITALKEAVARSVDVKIILPAKTDSGLIFHAGRSYYDELLNAGIEIYERGDALLHAKTAVIDGVWSTVGSTNLDWRSFLHSDELNAVVLSTAFGAQMNTMFEKDLVASQRITLESWRGRPLGFRVKEHGARLWVYWL